MRLQTDKALSRIRSKAKWHIFSITLWPLALHWSPFFNLLLSSLLKRILYFPLYTQWLLAGTRRISHPPSNFTHDEASTAQSILFRGEGLCCLDVACGKVVYLLESFMLSRIERKASVHTCLPSPFRCSRKRRFWFEWPTFRLSVIVITVIVWRNKSKERVWQVPILCLKSSCMLFWIKHSLPGGLVSLTNQFCLLQLDQLVVDAAKEKRDMEQKHSTIQQKVHTHSQYDPIFFYI